MKLKDKILDADGHIIERDSEIFEYLEAPYAGNDTLLGFPFFPTLDGYHRGAILGRLGIHKDYTISAKAWLEFLDGVGIDSTVLYPTTGLAFGMIQDPTWAVALARAYNNWFTDRFHRVSPRLRAVALVPIQDVPEAVKELRRAVTELGMVGVVLPRTAASSVSARRSATRASGRSTRRRSGSTCRSPCTAAPSFNLGINFFNRFALTHALEHPLAQMIQLTSMVMEGVFERFPKLRVAYLEAGAGWVPYIMDRLDRSYEVWAGAKYREFSDWLKKKPSEYIASGQIYFSCEGGEQSLGATRCSASATGRCCSPRTFRTRRTSSAPGTRSRS